MIDPAASLSPTQTRDELSSLLDRARQERFRLLELMQEARAAVQTSADDVAASVSESDIAGATSGGGDVQRLIDKVQRLNTVVTQRLEKLEGAESRAKGQIQHLERLELKMTNMAERFEQLVADAREVEPVLSQAEQRATQLHAAADALQQHGHDLSKTIDTRLADHTAEFEKRLDDHHELLVSQQIKEFSSFGEAVARQKQVHLDQLSRELSEKRAELLAQFEQNHEQSQLETEQAAIVRAGELRERLSVMADEVLGDADRRGTEALGQLREQIVSTMGRADDINRTVRQRLEDALLGHSTQMNQAMTAADDDLLVRGQKLDERMAGLADLFDHQADQILGDLKTHANTMLDNMAASLKTSPADPTPDTKTQGPQLKVA